MAPPFAPPPPDYNPSKDLLIGVIMSFAIPVLLGIFILIHYLTR